MRDRVTLGDLVGLGWFASLIFLLGMIAYPLGMRNGLGWTPRYWALFFAALAVNGLLYWLGRRMGR